MTSEIIVVDNLSADGSIEYLKPKFPDVRFIASDTNLGFGRASNRGAELANGKYVLFLNPDTLIEEDCLTKSIQFFEAHPDAGAVGVKMIDGSGKFLKESKRSFPSPLTSLYKLFGLSALFPYSKIFSRYYAGHLDENKNHSVDVLAGAFLMLPKEVLEKAKGFDESFFMYGEDIDLSYRIQQLGYKNYYLGETSIIHFKGESTRRGSLNYVRMFYKAMSIFVKKHYGGTKAGFFNASLHFAIWLRAIIAAFAKLIRWGGLPFIDAIIILFSFWITKEIWSFYVKPDVVYSNKLLLIAFPVYTLLYLTVAYYAGLYNKSYRQSELNRSMIIATLVLLAGYALLPEKYRFSRAVVLLGSLLAFVLISVLRWLMLRGKVLQKSADTILKPYMLIASSADEFDSIKDFLDKNGLKEKVIGRVAIDADLKKTVTSLNNLNRIASTLGAEEILFCIGKLSYKDVFRFISFSSCRLRLRFHAMSSCSIVGSDSETSAGEIISSESYFNLQLPNNRRMKRLIDVIAAGLLLIFFPVHFFLVKHPMALLKNCIAVIAGRKTWIGYSNNYNGALPLLRKSVLNVKSISQSVNTQQVDYWYAKNYEPSHDIRLIVKNYKHLGI